MVVNRWFFGIQALAGYQKSVLHYTTANKNTYLVAYEASYDNVAGLQFVIHGTASDTIRRPADIVDNGHAVVTDGVGVGTIRNENICIRLDENTRIGISSLPGATSSTLRVSFTTVELSESAANADRPRDYVMAHAKSSNTRTFTGYEVVSAATNHFLEFDVNGKIIVQPATQGTPAVADELNVVSTSTSDTSAGAGARTIKFKYLDDNLVEHTSNAITMNGQTPVSIVGTYADVWITLESWVVTAGANGRNIGHILFQDNA